MQIAKLDRYPIHINQSMLTNTLTTNKLSDLSFSSLLDNIISDKNISTKESIEGEKSEISCDCDQDEIKCLCGSDKDISAILESDKKSGIEACMDCENRKNGQCDLWNGEDGDDPFDILAVSSRDNGTTDVAKMSDLQANLDLIAISSLQFDYTNAYAYAHKKVKYTDNGWIE